MKKRLIEKHIIKESNLLYNELDILCLKSKNLYNTANYIVRKEFIFNKKYFHPLYNNSVIRDNNYGDFNNPYKELPAKVSNGILGLLDQNWKSFFAAIKDWKKNPEKYTGKPNIPKYLEKNGRFVIVYDKQAISKKELQDSNIIYLSKTNIRINSYIKYEDLKQVRIIPRYGYYVIEIVYSKEIETVKRNTQLRMSIDLGINNLCGIFCETGKTYLINGKPLKSINQYFNKTKSKLSSCLKKCQDSFDSKHLRRLHHKREMKILDYLHKASKKIIEIALENNIDEIIIGLNKQWKTNSNLGKKNNQNFVSIPFNKLINMITYKAEFIGIKVQTIEESFTSITNNLLNEKLQNLDDYDKNFKYSGKRVFRGLFKVSDQRYINSDINSTIGIIRKAVPHNDIKFIKGIEGISVYPTVINL